MDARSRTITEVLAGAADEERLDLETLLPLVYDELHQLAASHFRAQRSDHTWQPTVLVNEVYLRLADHTEIRARSRRQFFALAAQIMRRLLVDHAREKHAAKRGGGRRRVTLSGLDGNDAAAPIDLLALDEALTALAAHTPEAAHVVELRFFGGLTNEEIGAMLGMSRGAVDRRWRAARAWLYEALAATDDDDDDDDDDD